MNVWCPLTALIHNPREPTKRNRAGGDGRIRTFGGLPLGSLAESWFKPTHPRLHMEGRGRFELPVKALQASALTAWLPPRIKWRLPLDLNQPHRGCLHISLPVLNYFLHFIIFCPSNSFCLTIFGW